MVVFCFAHPCRTMPGHAWFISGWVQAFFKFAAFCRSACTEGIPPMAGGAALPFSPDVLRACFGFPSYLLRIYPNKVRRRYEAGTKQVGTK
jgi:hypothetical protein